MQTYTAEFFGTWFLTLAFGLSGNVVATGFILTALIYIWGNRSGAHFNPAVTIAFWAARGMPPGKFWGYIGCQCLGALAGALVIFYLAGSTLQFAPPSSSTPLQYSAVEWFFTLLFALVYLTLFLSPEYRERQLHGIVIGITYAGLLMAGESISGAVYNPALAAGAFLVDLMREGHYWNWLPAYLLAPLLGGLFAGHLFNYIERGEKHG